MLVFRICFVLHTNRINEDYRVCDSQSCCSLLVAKQLLVATTALSGRSSEVYFLECGGRIESFTAFCERDVCANEPARPSYLLGFSSRRRCSRLHDALYFRGGCSDLSDL